jgi:esterase/lipase superfamily enzyme
MANSFVRGASQHEYRGYALLIGVGECAYSKWSLPVTVKDVTAVKEILVDPSLCGYPDNDGHIRLLCNEKATRQSILDGLQWLKEVADRDPEATIVIYYSGHGCLNPANGSYYLIPHDADPMDFGTSALAGADFTKALHSIKSQKLLVILDCCHAEGVASGKGVGIESQLPKGIEFKLPDGLNFRLPPGFEPQSAKGQFSTLAEGKGIAILSSSDSNQISWIRKDQTCSVFTSHLIEALRGAGNQEGDRSVTVMNLIEYLGKTVSATAKSEHQAEQNPQSDYKGSNHFPIALLRGGNGLPKGGYEGMGNLPPGLPNLVQNVTGNQNQVIGQVTGGTVIGNITGDGVFIGNNNSYQKVEQHGKNNFNIERAENLHIGDTYGVDNRSDRITRGGKSTDSSTKPSLDSIDPKAESSEKGIKVKPQGLVEVPVFFATDRQHLNTASVKTYYGGKRNPTDALEFGIATVSIPEDHRMGEIERPSWWKLELSEDPAKHLVLMNINAFDRNSFVNTLRQSVANSKASDLLLFIHGYNTSFEDAAIRTAQIAYDLQFPGQAILYSWPSEAKLEGYTADENNIDWTLPHFEEFLNLLLTSVGADMVNTIAHSMGNRIMVRALDRLNYSTLPENAAKLRNVIFAAPDIDAATFKQFVKQFKQKADRLTLYASSNDKALKASMSVHGGYPRAGIAGVDITIVDGLDTIDASDVDTSFMGHSYFGDNRSIISDIFYLIKHGFSPNDRSGLKPKTIQNLGYWFFQP